MTSFHEEAYEAYAKDCLSTLEKFFPGKIVAYIEGGSYDHPKVEFRDFWGIKGARDYIEKLKKHPGSNGVLGHYDFRFDASKFCRKVFAQDAAFDEDQYVFWFDADCIVKKPIPAELLVLLVELPFAYLGRNGAAAYTETGWLGFNTQHPDFKAFRAKYLPYFTTGRIFSQLKGWHDCIAFDYAREGITGNNLTPRGMSMDNVIQDSAIGKYVAHLKGPRKFSDKHKRDAFERS